VDSNKIHLQYLLKITEKLEQQNFKIEKNLEYDNQVFEYIAKRRKFEIERFGFCTTFFLFARFKTPNIYLLNDFSTKALRYAKKDNGIHPPRGFFYVLLCFPVAIVDSIDQDTVEQIRNKEPPRHWAASEKLVVYSLETAMLFYCEATFTYGALYYDWDRKIIKEILTP
jgi:hypothetical protein